MSGFRSLLRGLIPYPPTEEMRDAIRAGNVATVRRLLDAGFDPRGADGDGPSFFLTAVERGLTDIVEAFLAAGADPNAAEPETGEAPLLIAVVCEQPAVAELLIRRGARVDGRDANGWTPLMHAADGSDPEMVALLLRYGADAAAKSPGGDTPLSVARRVAEGDPEDDYATRTLGLLRSASGDAAA